MIRQGNLQEIHKIPHPAIKAQILLLLLAQKHIRSTTKTPFLFSGTRKLSFHADRIIPPSSFLLLFWSLSVSGRQICSNPLSKAPLNNLSLSLSQPAPSSTRPPFLSPPPPPNFFLPTKATHPQSPSFCGGVGGGKGGERGKEKKEARRGKSSAFQYVEISVSSTTFFSQGLEEKHTT